MAWLAILALVVIIIASTVLLIRVWKRKQIEKKALYGFAMIYIINAVLMATVPYDGFLESIQYFLFLIDIGLFVAVLVSALVLGTVRTLNFWLITAVLTVLMDVIAYKEFTIPQNVFDSTVWLVIQCAIVYLIMLKMNMLPNKVAKYALIVSYAVTAVSFAMIPPTSAMETAVSVVLFALVGAMIFLFSVRKGKGQKNDRNMSKAVDLK